MGEEDVLLNSISNTQPYLGSLFKSQNQSTWTPSQLEDLKFTLRKANFVTNTPSIVLLDNAELNSAIIRRDNPVFAYSKRANVSIASTTTASPLVMKLRKQLMVSLILVEFLQKVGLLMVEH